ncbi:MAG: GtrA family protein [Pseudolabrys sp.]
MVAATATLVLLSEWLGLGVLPAKLISILVSFVVNFSLSHFVVFRKRTPPSAPLKVRDKVMQHDDNLTAKLPNFVTHLECAMTGERHEADQIHNLSRAGKPLLVRYDLAGVKKALTKDKLAARPADLWRYRELLPVRDPANIVSLG